MPFGFSQAELDSTRRTVLSRAWTVVRIGVELLVLVAASLLGGALWLFTTPEGLQRVTDQWVGDAPVTARVADVEVLPTSRLLEPDTWQVAVVGVDVAPDDPDQPLIHIDRVVFGLPDLIHAWYAYELHFERLRIIGLDIHARRQRPPKPWEPRDTALDSLHAERAEVWDAHFHADADEPLPAVDTDRIYGELTDLEYAPGSRELSGKGFLRGGWFEAGAIEVQRPAIEVLADRSNLVFDGSFELYGVPATVHGEVLHFHKRAEVQLEVEAERFRIERLIAAGSGAESPLFGWAEASFVVRSGGDRPRGGGVILADAVIEEGQLALGEGVGGLTRDLLHLAPFIELDDEDRVQLGRTRGRMTLDRERIDLRELLYDAPRRTLQLWGWVAPEDMELFLRVVPPRHPERRAGFGAVFTRPEDKLRIRLARKDELRRHLGIELDAEPTETRDASLDEPRVVWRWPWKKKKKEHADTGAP